MPLIMIGSLFLTLYCTKLLLVVADDHGSSFSEIAFAAGGSKLQTLTEVLIIASQMGFCINYVYFISSQIGSVFNCARTGADPATCSQAGVVKNDVQLWYFLPALMLVYVPLVMIRKIEKLAWTHLVSDVLIVSVVVAIFVYGGINIADNDQVYVNDLFTGKFFLAIPFSAFAFEGVAVVLPLREITEDQ